MKETKKSLRKQGHSQLLAQTEEKRRLRSLDIQKRLSGLPVFQKAKLVLFFVSLPEEVDTHPMIEEALRSGKRVAVPVADLKTKKLLFFEIRDKKKDLKPGVYGILEPDPYKTKPVSPKKADCVIVPGLVFDLKKHRIGHGAGFYDRFLAEIGDVPKIGLAYSFQIIEEIPRESHDVALDEIITDQEN